MGYEKLLEKAEEFKPQRIGIREDLGIKENDFVILYVGRLSTEKAPLICLDAYRRLDNKNKKLFVVGDGPMRKEFEEYIRNFNIKNVKLTGFQSRKNLPDFYTVADVLVLPSFRETWGIVINEAMCFGLPIITSDKIGAAVDLVREDYNGFIFPSGDAEKLSICIEKLINLTSTEREVFGRRSFEIVNQWVKSIDPIKQIIKALELAKNKSI